MNIREIAEQRQLLRDQKAKIQAERKAIKQQQLKPLAEQQSDLECQIYNATEQIRRQIDKEQKRELVAIVDELRLPTFKRKRNKRGAEAKTTSRISIDYGRLSRRSDMPEQARKVAIELEGKARQLERLIKELTEGKAELLTSLDVAALETAHSDYLISVSLDMPQGVYL